MSTATESFLCLGCGHAWWDAPGPHGCPACGHLYVDWLNFPGNDGYGNLLPRTGGDVSRTATELRQNCRIRGES